MMAIHIRKRLTLILSFCVYPWVLLSVFSAPFPESTPSSTKGPLPALTFYLVWEGAEKRDPFQEWILLGAQAAARDLGVSLKSTPLKSFTFNTRQEPLPLNGLMIGESLFLQEKQVSTIIQAKQEIPVIFFQDKINEGSFKDFELKLNEKDRKIRVGADPYWAGKRVALKVLSLISSARKDQIFQNPRSHKRKMKRRIIVPIWPKQERKQEDQLRGIMDVLSKVPESGELVRVELNIGEDEKNIKRLKTSLSKGELDSSAAICLDLACVEILLKIFERDRKNFLWGSMVVSPEILTLIKKGVVKFAIMPRPFTIGYLGVSHLGQQMPNPRALKEINSGMDWVSSMNVNQFMQLYSGSGQKE